jgi:hypothetical protein
MNTTTLPSGLILVSQPEQIGITPKDMTDALPDAYKSLPRETVDLDVADAARQAIQSGDWSAAQRSLEQQVQAKLRPLRERSPDWQIVYFGSAPIPLAIHLGFLLETWQGVEIIPHHHHQRAWRWLQEPGKPPARLVPPVLPEERDRTPGEAIIRVSTSHKVDAHLTRHVAPDPLVDIDIALEHPAEDIFSSLQDMQEVARAFREALDAIGDRFTGVHRVHLFASVQPGMGLLLGAQISKTMHPAVQTYQYARNAESGPYHTPAVLINGPSRPELPPLTPEEQARAQRDREQLATDLERMKGRATQEKKVQAATWIAGLLSDADVHPDFSGMWQTLPLLRQTPLPRTRVAVEIQTVADSFLFASDAWQIDENWLARLTRRLPEDARRHRGLRLLVLHEAMHRGAQGLTSTVSREMGRFPKVLEEIDYHADVWAMLYERALTESIAPLQVASPQRFFLDMVRIATDTMWAFDDDGVPLREIQVRRLNRYLIWYWQYLLLEHGTGHAEEMTLQSVLALLAQRPILELAGPRVIARDERVFFNLEEARTHTPELAIYHRGRLHRHGSRLDLDIQALLDGVRARDGNRILEVLRAAVPQVAR